MGCLSNHAADLLLCLAYFLLLLSWSCYCYKKRFLQSTILHSFITIFLSIKLLYILPFIFCYIQGQYSWFSIVSTVLTAIIFAVDGGAVLGCFFFTSLGVGLCSLSDRGFDSKFMMYLFTMNYAIRGLLFFYTGIMSAIYPVYLVSMYWVLVKTLIITQEYLWGQGVGMYYKKLGMLNRFRSALSIYVLLCCIYYTCASILIYMDRDTEVMDLCFRGLEAAFFWYLLYVIRPSEVFTHDFLEITNRNVESGFIVADLS